MDHPRRDFFHPLIVCATVFDAESPACYMAVSRIARCAIAPATIGFDYEETM